MDKWDKWQQFKYKAYLKGEDMQKANERFEKWLIKKQIKKNKKEHPYLYRKGGKSA